MRAIYRVVGRPWTAAVSVLLALLILVAGPPAPGTRAAPDAAMFGPNLRVNQTQTDQQQEPSLAINPQNPQMVVAAAKDWRNGRKEVWHYHSTDGGTTWADVHLAGLPADLPNQSDPVVVYDADGVVYTSLIVYNQDDFTQGGLFVAHSTDNGATWSPPVVVAHNADKIFNDKEWLTVDRSPTPSRGTLYVTWTRFTTVSEHQDRGDIMAISSTDGGTTWSAPVPVSNARTQSDVQGSFPAVGPDGALNVLYYDQTTTPQLALARSTDRGLSFTAPSKVADVRRPPSPFPTSKFRMFVLPALAINPVDGALVATWNDYPGNSDILLAGSRDSARTWSAPVRVNDDSTAADQFFPTVVFSPQGLLHIAWLDRRDDPRNLTFACYYTQSTDDGRTFAPNIRIADAQSDPSVGFGGTLIGDYIQVDAVADHAEVAWVDTRTGDQNIYAAVITGSLGTTPEPSPVPGTPVSTPGPTPVLTPGGVPPGPPAPLSYFVDPAFAEVWQRSDQPVQAGIAGRPWLWGPAPFAAGHEPYAQGVNGQRLVQYFDKSRMEINNPDTDRAQKWYVTNGLLVVEMMTGQVQLGDSQYSGQGYAPNPLPVAGDPGSPEAPTYATLARVASLHGDNRAPDLTGSVVSGLIDQAGTVTGGAPPIPAAGGVRAIYYDPTLGHNIPTVFWAFMNQQGPIDQAGQVVQGPVVDPLFDLGHPITEAYWARLRIAGQDHWALIQAYQRRVLTYVPDNAPAWQVEMGNVGRHYFDWRYGPHSPYADLRGDDAGEDK
ncbi:MAG TPA: sialidase family protein [Chloroflexia bacterium]|nr:sialidase family protein [Chloroflexia bacterium]